MRTHPLSRELHRRSGPHDTQAVHPHILGEPPEPLRCDCDITTSFWNVLSLRWARSLPPGVVSVSSPAL